MCDADTHRVPGRDDDVEEDTVFELVLTIVVLLAVSTLAPAESEPNPLLDSPWFWVHMLSLLFAYASFALATAVRPRSGESSGSSASTLVSMRDTKNDATDWMPVTGSPASRRSAMPATYASATSR